VRHNIISIIDARIICTTYPLTRRRFAPRGEKKEQAAGSGVAELKHFLQHAGQPRKTGGCAVQEKRASDC